MAKIGLLVPVSRAAADLLSMSVTSAVGWVGVRHSAAGSLTWEFDRPVKALIVGW